jgi:hypothetical protein
MPQPQPGLSRLLSNERVTVERLIEGWGQAAAGACGARHVLAIQDLSEVNFGVRAGDRRGLRPIGHGDARGVLLHVMAAVDAEDGALLGLVSGRVWTRPGLVGTPHRQRALADREAAGWRRRKRPRRCWRTPPA